MGRVPTLALVLVLALVATGAPAQVTDDPDRARPPGREAGVAPDAATGFARVGGAYATLPGVAPRALERPTDPEDDAPDDDAPDDDEARTGEGPDGRRTIVVLPSGPGAPTPAPGDRPGETPAERRIADAPVTAGPGDMPAPDALPPVRDRLAETDAEFAACTARLTALGTTFESVPALIETRDRDCGIVRPVKVSQVVPGVALAPDAIMRCDAARALAEWMADDVLPAAAALGASVSAVDHGSTYICRRRNNRATGELSEHAFGNAVDVMGFRFSDRDAVRIEPRGPGGKVATFQRAVREASCEHFTTVIGPGTNAAHADHLHLDVKQRRGGYRLCE